MAKKRFDPRNVHAAEHLPIVAAIVWDPSEYSPRMRQIWADSRIISESHGEDFPEVYSGSVRGECTTCGVGVALGPHQQETLATWDAAGTVYEVHCLICAVRRIYESGQQKTAIVNLDNPEFRHG